MTPARALAQPPTSARWHPRFDLAGAWLSLACAAHCIALPLLLAFVPAAMMALRSFQHPGHGAMTLLLMMSRWEWLFALLASSIVRTRFERHCANQQARAATLPGKERRDAFCQCRQCTGRQRGAAAACMHVLAGMLQQEQRRVVGAVQ